MPEVIVSLVGHCENLKSRFAVIDMPGDLYKTADLINYRGMIDSTYAAMYHPWIEVFDRSANKSDFIPPSGAVMGVYSRTDQTRGVHKAPANEVVFCTGLKTNYTKDEQDMLNPEGINLIRALPGQGIRHVVEELMQPLIEVRHRTAGFIERGFFLCKDVSQCHIYSPFCRTRQAFMYRWGRCRHKC